MWKPHIMSLFDKLQHILIVTQTILNNTLFKLMQNQMEIILLADYSWNYNAVRCAGFVQLN